MMRHQLSGKLSKVSN